MTWRRHSIVVVVLVAIFSMARAATRIPEIWFCPRPLVTAPANVSGGAADYFVLFESPGSWASTLKHVKVFKIYQRLIQNGDEQKLAQMFEFLRRNHIELALELGFLSDSDSCGRGIEGYTGRFAADVARKVKRLGGEVAIVDMDEPLWYGMEFRGPRACHSDIESIARDAAQHLAELRSIFPSVRVGDTEPVLEAPTDAQWPDRISQWTQAFQAAYGQKLEFFHADVVWSSSWQGALQAVSKAIRAQGIAFGVIYNSDRRDKNNIEAMEQMLGRSAAVEATIPMPDQVVFQSWQRYPDRVTPETETGSMTGTILKYVKQNGH